MQLSHHSDAIVIAELSLLPLFADSSSTSMWENVLISRGEIRPSHLFMSVSRSAVTHLPSTLLSPLQCASAGKAVPRRDMKEAVNNTNIQ